MKEMHVVEQFGYMKKVIRDIANRFDEYQSKSKKTIRMKISFHTFKELLGIDKDDITLFKSILEGTRGLFDCGGCFSEIDVENSSIVIFQEAGAGKTVILNPDMTINAKMI